PHVHLFGRQPRVRLIGAGAARLTPAPQLIPDRFGIAYPAGRAAIRVRGARHELPRIPEKLCDLLDSYAARSESTAARLKREHDQPSPWSCHHGDSLGVPLALGIGEAVQAAAIDQELVAVTDPECLQASDVAEDPVDIDTAHTGAAPRPVQCARDAVDAGDGPAALGEVD